MSLFQVERPAWVAVELEFTQAGALSMRCSPALRRTAVLVPLVASIAVAACNKDVTRPTRSAVSPRGVSDLIPMPSLNGREGERPIANIAANVPTFGGFFLQPDGGLAAYVVSDSDATPAKSALQALIRDSLLTHGWIKRNPPILILKGRYSYRELANWRAQVTESVLTKSVAGFAWDYIDFSGNRIRVGVLRSALAPSTSALQTVLAKLGIPAAAVEVVATDGFAASSGLREPPTARTMTATDDSLTSAATTFMAGIIAYGNGPCTAGAIIDYSGHGRQMITDSHCSTSEFAYDGTTFHMAGGVPYGSAIGAESYDPSGYTCVLGGITYTNRCRESEQILVSMTATTARGAIARTNGTPDSTWHAGGADGTLVRSTTHPFFAVFSAGGGVTQHQLIYKIGRWTGWNMGTVISTCADIVVPVSGTDYVIQCSVTTSVPSHSGDSGGPVFTWDGSCDCVALKGFHFGSDTLGHVAAYSPYDRFITDMGVSASSFNALTDITVGTPSASGQVVTSCGLSGVPEISWSAVTTTNSPYTTYYDLYRTADGGGSWTLLTTLTGGAVYDDCAVTVTSYNGTSFPAGSSYGYYVGARNAGVTPTSPTIWFNQ